MSQSPGINNTMSGGAKLDNQHSAILLALVLVVVATSQHVFSKVPAFANPEAPTAIMAYLAGAIVALITYIPVKHVYGGPMGLTNNQVMSIAGLMGLISAYFMLFEVKPGLPSIGAMALMVFMFYHHFDLSLSKKEGGMM